jgi:hypothetical protein
MLNIDIDAGGYQVILIMSFLKCGSDGIDRANPNRNWQLMERRACKS